MEEKIIIVPRARPAVDFASNLLVIPKDDFDEYVNEINAHHVKFIRSLESSWNIKADGRAIEAIKMVKEEYKEIIAKKDKEIVELKEQVHDYALGLFVIQAKAGKEACHHKYKRCRAMAEFCQYRSEMFFTWSKKMGFLLKWQNRWLELAEKFKEAK